MVCGEGGHEEKDRGPEFTPRWRRAQAGRVPCARTARSECPPAPTLHTHELRVHAPSLCLRGPVGAQVPLPGLSGAVLLRRLAGPGPERPGGSQAGLGQVHAGSRAL